MPLIGKLRTWHDDKGFGFIAPSQGGAEIFVHIGDLPRDGSRPVVGETLRYELGRGEDGRPRAVRVVRLAVGTPPPPARRLGGRPRGGSSGRLSTLLSGVLGLAVLAGVGAWGYRWFEAQSHRRHLEDQPASVAPQPAAAADAGFRCDGRTHCSQMKSCAEATWFINHCPGTQMDGNHDGVPCEQQLCTGSLGR